MVSRLKYQVNKDCIKFDNILKATVRKKLLEPEQTHKAGDETELTDAKSQGGNGPRPLHPKPVFKNLGTTASAWPGQAAMHFKTTQFKPRPTRCRSMAVYTFGWVSLNYHATAKRLTTSLPKNFAKQQDEVAWLSSRSWWCGTRLGMAQKPGERQPTTHHSHH